MRRTSPTRARGSMLIGVFVGLVLGLALAAGIAVYLAKSGLTTPISTPPSRDPLRAGKQESGVIVAAPEKPRFDFYKILPGNEEPRITAKADRPDRAERAADNARQDAARASERFWLQAGAFSSSADAENMKAQLALSGWEAAIQPATLPDSSVRYRVRLGPYDNSDEVTRMKSELGRRGFDVAVIKNP